MFNTKLISLFSTSARLIQQNATRNFTTTQQLKQNIKHYIPNNFEKKLLVWSGKYKTIQDIPSHVSYEEMERCRNKVRIRVANIMIAITIVGCVIMVYSGKQAAKRGESVTQQNFDWHRKYNEQAAQKEKEKEN